MEKQSSNHGEGDPEAAERFNTAEGEFVNSDRGKKKIKEGAQVMPGDEGELKQAERAGRARAKEDNSGGPARK